ncbi:DUF572-domain-containing protein [Martensiomyces pterosporus]|nr:DUF572-domain-containing protein [Martensiomyces pterosporus]
MAERKVLNKYIPPDFDPSKIPRLRLGKNHQIKVRLMAPFSMRCETCGQWIGKGTKFNARKEPIEGEKFHSIQIYRFYIRCQRCAAEITFKTDPENLNYKVEKGAQRNFEPWREEKALNEELQQQKEEEEENNPIKALENRTEESRREMEILDALDDIRMQNAKGERVGSKDVLETIAERGQKEDELRRREEEREDEMLVKQAFSTAGGRRIKRAREEDAVERERGIKSAAASATRQEKEPADSKTLSLAALGVKRVKPKQEVVVAAKAPSPPPTLSSMLGAYGAGSSDDDDDNTDEE